MEGASKADSMELRAGGEKDRAEGIQGSQFMVSPLLVSLSRLFSQGHVFLTPSLGTASPASWEFRAGHSMSPFL